MILNLKVTGTERAVIVAALMESGYEDMARRIGEVDTADEGPEVKILAVAEAGKIHDRDD